MRPRCELAGDAEGRVWVSVNRGVRSEVDEFRDGALKTAYRWPEGIVARHAGGERVAAAGTGGQLAFTVGDPAHMGNVAVPMQQTGMAIIFADHA